MEPQRTRVLIVGGGPVGLALSIELGWRGIDNILVDRRDGSIPLPKMNGVNARTMEHCRRWGLAEAVRGAGWPGDYPVRMTYCTSVRGHEFFRFDRGTTATRPPSATTPEHFQRCPQTFFDPLLREHARTLPTNTLRYLTRLEGFTQDAHGVRAELVEVADGGAGRRSAVECDYMVGCDGAASTVRQTLGIPADGHDLLSQEVNIYFESTEVFAGCEERRAAMIWLIGPQGMWGSLAAIDGRRTWRLWVSRVPTGTNFDDPAAFDAAGLVRAALGADVPFRIFGVLPWARQKRVARRYREGRVFLAGDAVHNLTPTGGFGMNTGIADAVDLGWKLAAVFAGWGGAALLDSYEFERRPVAMRTVDESTHTYGLLEQLPAFPELDAPGAAGEAARAHLRELFAKGQYDREYRNEGIVLGYRYEPSTICIPDGSEAPPARVMTWMPDARPGSRAPHVPLADGRSTLDLFGRGFVLLRLGGDAPDARAFVAAARQRDTPLTVATRDEPAVRAAYAAPLVLVRPDGHVAWRGLAMPDDPFAVIDTIRGATPRAVEAPGPAIYCQPPGIVSSE